MQDLLKPGLDWQNYHFYHILVIKASHKVNTDPRSEILYLLMEKVSKTHRKGMDIGRRGIVAIFTICHWEPRYEGACVRCPAAVC